MSLTSFQPYSTLALEPRIHCTARNFHKKRRYKYNIMGNNNGKKNIMSEGDIKFLRENTSISTNDLAMYDNFLIKHPDGEIARKEFRLIIILYQRNKYILLTFQHHETYFMKTLFSLNSYYFSNIIFAGQITIAFFLLQ